MTKRGRKSSKWHEARRCENMVLYLEKQMQSGRFVADEKVALDWLISQKVHLARLERQLAREGSIAKINV